MRPIIINMDEMSDSKEVYDSRPNPFFMIFTYAVLFLIIIALVWMYFAEIEIVVKSQGMIRPNDNVSTVSNLISGEIISVNIEDGQVVKKGDILYIIDHKQMILDKERLYESIEKITAELDLLNKYKKALEDEKNYFSKEKEEQYYIKFINYILNYKSMSHNINYEEKYLLQELSNNEFKLDEMKKEKVFLDRYKNSINEGKNLFNINSEQEYYTQVDKYFLDYKSLHQQYDDREEEIKLNTSEELLNNSIIKLNEDLLGYQNIVKSIKNDVNYLLEGTIYEKKFLEYNNKLIELENLYNQAYEIYEMNVELEDYGISKQEIENSKNSMDKALASIEEYKLSALLNYESNIVEIEEEIKKHKINQDNSLSKEKLIEKVQNEKKNEIKKYKLESTVQIDKQIEQLEQNIVNLESVHNKLILDKDKNFVMNIDDNIDDFGSLLIYKTNELSSTIDLIKQHNEELLRLRVELDKINNNIENAVIKAQMDGIINLNKELVIGDILSSGTPILTIIPHNDTKFKVGIYVDNNDIAKLYEGMEVKYNIYALPTSEYGDIMGKVVKISKDIKFDQNNQGAHYFIEGIINNKPLYDNKGNEANIKIGMNCEAQLITGKKKILFYLLEKIDLWD